MNGEFVKRYSLFLLIISILVSLTACKSEEHKHTVVRVAATAATCTATGNDEYYRCTGCEKLFQDPSCQYKTTIDRVTVEPTEHSFKDATCTTPQTCSACGTSQGDALNHKWSGDCDTECNREGCGSEREAQSHLDSDESGTCDVCGRVLSPDIELGGGDGEFLPTDEF